MYNLFVFGNPDTYDGGPIHLELTRCVREWTDTDMTSLYGELDATAKEALQNYPCIFACEARHKVAPKFGLITKIAKQTKMVRIGYEIREPAEILSFDDFIALATDLGIYNTMELSRTHWSVKEVNLPKVLQSRGLYLPTWMRSIKMVDITNHLFDVAFSFPGEARHIVEPIAREIEILAGEHTCFYDNNYRSQLARPSLDMLFHDLYGNRSKLIVVFLSGDYQKKEWCGVEFRVVREFIMGRDTAKIMYIRTDDGIVDGVLKTDGYIDSRKFTSHEIVNFILERIKLLS